jgi:hypothetical protein
MADRGPGGDAEEYRELGVLTSRQVLSGQEPVRIVVHDEDGDWQIICGTTEEAQDAVLVGINHLFELDSELESILGELPIGTQAWREEPGQEWHLETFEYEEGG